MSKAFTREDDDAPAPVRVSPRAPLPVGSPNYVTPNGALRLRRERDELALHGSCVSGEDRVAALARLAEIDERLAITEIVPQEAKPTVVRLGVRVRYESALHGERSITLVGVDDANPDDARIAWTSPIARALAGRGVGESTVVRTPAGEDELTVVALEAGDR